MKFTALEKRLAKLEAAIVPPGGQWLRVVIHEHDNEAEKAKKQQQALAEHVVCHPEDAGRTVEDFNWIVRILFRPRHAEQTTDSAGIGDATAAEGN